MRTRVPLSKRLRVLAGRVGQALPFRLGMLPYAVISHWVAIEARGGFPEARAEAWARNSFRLGTLQPLFSDLDITLWFPEASSRPSRKELSRFFGRLRLLHKAFPLLGEVNVYHGRDRALLAEVINPWEVARDPALLSRLSGVRDADAANAIVFLMRMLESDLENIRFFPELRLRKWGSHLSAVSQGLGIGLDEKLREGRSLEDRVRAFLVGLLPVSSSERQEAGAWLEAYFQERRAKVPLHESRLELRAQPWGWIFFPNRFCFKEGPSAPLPPELAPLFVEQIRWECFGALTQHPVGFESETWAGHLGHLKRLAPLAGRDPELSRALTALELTLAWLRENGPR